MSDVQEPLDDTPAPEAEPASPPRLEPVADTEPEPGAESDDPAA